MAGALGDRRGRQPGSPELIAAADRGAAVPAVVAVSVAADPKAPAAAVRDRDGPGPGATCRARYTRLPGLLAVLSCGWLGPGRRSTLVV